MFTQTLSPTALDMINNYLHFHAGVASCAMPYFNNKTIKARMTTRASIGKGSPADILEEVQYILVKEYMSVNTLTDTSLKKLLIDKNLGIDCSGFTYHILDVESRERDIGSLNKHIIFTNCQGFIGRWKCSLRPVENCDVATLAHDKNSKVVSLHEIVPGDIVTMLDITKKDERNHVLIIHKVEYQGSIPKKIDYSHAIAYPTDGFSGGSVRQGSIEIPDNVSNILDCIWREEGRTEEQNPILTRARNSKTEVRRIHCFR